MVMREFNKSNSQLIAHCFFSKTDSKVKYNNYDKYYGEKVQDRR